MAAIRSVMEQIEKTKKLFCCTVFSLFLEVSVKFYFSMGIKTKKTINRDRYSSFFNVLKKYPNEENRKKMQKNI